MIRDRLMRKVIQYKSVSIHSRALYLLARAAHQVPLHLLSSGGHPHPLRARCGQCKPYSLSACQAFFGKGCEQGFSVTDRRQGYRLFSWCQCARFPHNHGGCFRDRSHRTAIGPSAGQRCAGAEAESMSLLIRIAHITQHGGRKKRKISKTSLRIVECKRIYVIDIEAAKSPGLHLTYFPLNLRLRHRRPKPPPSHHGSGAVWRRLKALLQTPQT